jgi:2-hydroxy-6-oxonona-2,4-dienedioate hydrolase
MVGASNRTALTSAVASPGSLTLWLELLGSQVTQRWVDARGIRTRVLEAGDGEPLLLLHGTGGHAEAYGRNLAALAEHFRVIAFDLVGHGFSDKPNIPYTLDVYCQQLDALLDALKLDDAFLSGESLGGWVAAWYASRQPERVRRLVLTTPGNITSKPETMAKIRELTLQAVRDASPETVRARLEWLFAPQNRHLVTDELVEIRMRIYTAPEALQAMENVLVLQLPQVRASFAWDARWCGAIAAPTLILWTSHDPTGPVEEGRLLNSWIGDSQLVVLDGAGHWPQWERPADFNRIHCNFLLDHER